MYLVVWKYRIKPQFKDKFESEYGPNGRWAKLFNMSEYYQGSLLHASAEAQNTYLLIDHWENQESYEQFITEHESTYHAMSAELEYLYEVEERIGGFNDANKSINQTSL